MKTRLPKLVEVVAKDKGVVGSGGNGVLGDLEDKHYSRRTGHGQWCCLESSTWAGKLSLLIHQDSSIWANGAATDSSVVQKRRPQSSYS